MAPAAEFLQAVTERRSNYSLSPESTISDDEIKQILETTLEQAPSTFGSFTTRLVLLLKDEHYKYWDLVTEVVKAVTPPEQFEAGTKARLAGFRNAYGTILYFEDPENTRILENKFAFAKDMFAPWSQHTSAIHQFIVWTALTNAGMAANLQHYNPLVDDKVKATFKIPESWTLVAQMPFGKPTNPPGPKPTGFKKPLSERLLVLGA